MSRVGTYAVVPTRGRYASGSRVRALTTSDSLSRALTVAARATKSFRAGMRAHGGTSGGYRVVESDGQREWLGLDLDATPSKIRGEA